MWAVRDLGGVMGVAVRVGGWRVFTWAERERYGGSGFLRVRDTRGPAVL